MRSWMLTFADMREAAPVSLMRAQMFTFVCNLEAAGRLVWSIVTLWQKIRDHGERPRTKPTMPPVMTPPIM